MKFEKGDIVRISDGGEGMVKATCDEFGENIYWVSCDDSESCAKLVLKEWFNERRLKRIPIAADLSFEKYNEMYSELFEER